MVIILIISAKMATHVFIKQQYFENKGYDVIIPVYGITSKLLSSDSNYIVDVVM